MTSRSYPSTAGQVQDVFKRTLQNRPALRFIFWPPITAPESSLAKAGGE